MERVNLYVSREVDISLSVTYGVQIAAVNVDTGNGFSTSSSSLKTISDHLSLFIELSNIQIGCCFIYMIFLSTFAFDCSCVL